MNEEEIEKIIEMTIDKSNKEYISLKEQFEELRNDYIELARSEEQLQNNWNELKEDIPYILELIERNKDVIKVTSDEQLAIYSLQNKMQELEQGKDD